MRGPAKSGQARGINANLLADGTIHTGRPSTPSAGKNKPQAEEKLHTCSVLGDRVLGVRVGTEEWGKGRSNDTPRAPGNVPKHRAMGSNICRRNIVPIETQIIQRLRKGSTSRSSRHRAGRGRSLSSHSAVPAPVPMSPSIRKPLGASRAPEDPKFTGQSIGDDNPSNMLVQMAAKLLARGGCILAPTRGWRGGTLAPSESMLRGSRGSHRLRGGKTNRLLLRNGLLGGSRWNRGGGDKGLLQQAAKAWHRSWSQWRELWH